MARFIEYQQHRWRFVDLARSHHINPGTLYHRLERFGETATGIARALATGIMSREQAGKRRFLSLSLSGFLVIRRRS